MPLVFPAACSPTKPPGQQRSCRALHTTAQRVADLLNSQADQEDTMSGYIDRCNYFPTPRTTDPQAIIREKNIAIRWLLQQLAEREAEVTELRAGLAGTNP